ncbi:MAG: plasmid mobilization protein [Microbacterium sp.]
MSSNPEPKSAAVVRQVRFSRGQYILIEERAKKMGIPVSTYIRLVALNAAGSNVALAELNRVAAKLLEGTAQRESA